MIRRQAADRGHLRPNNGILHLGAGAGVGEPARRCGAPLFSALALGFVAATANARAQPCPPPASHVTITDSTVKLTFANGLQVTLTDVPPGDGQTDYRYRGYLPAIGHHQVELLLWGGPTTWVELYDGCSGEKLAVDAAPVISPDSTRFVTVGFGAPREPLAKRIQVWSRTPGTRFGVEWDFGLQLWAADRGPLDWGPSNPTWVSPTELRFDRVDRDGRPVGSAAAHGTGRRWVFSVVP
ncbi:MAG: hypothetical protein ACKVZ0_06185 [Gemmatimonadales bacterium]